MRQPNCGAWTDHEVETALSILATHPVGTPVDDICPEIGRATGRPCNRKSLRHVLKARGLRSPRDYVGAPGRAGAEVSATEPVTLAGDVDVDLSGLSGEEPDEAPPDFDTPLPEHLDGTGDTGFAGDRLRVVIPDSHGCYIDPKAAKAFLEDLKMLDPDEIVFLGDHVDVSGMYSSHPPNYVDDLKYSYEADIASADAFIDAVQKRAPRARCVYLEGNHEFHVERSLARTTRSARDAAAQLELQAPASRLRLKDRGIRYCRMAEMHDGLSIPGTIRLGKAFFTHGFTAAKFATAIHCVRYGANVIHGHTHRVQEYGTRTVASDAIGGWCPGTLALLQPLYRHTSPTEWRHGFAVQSFDRQGRFVHVNAPVVNGWSGLRMLLNRIRPVKMIGDL